MLEEEQRSLAELKRKYEPLLANYTLLLEKEEAGNFFESFKELRGWLARASSSFSKKF